MNYLVNTFLSLGIGQYRIPTMNPHGKKGDEHEEMYTILYLDFYLKSNAQYNEKQKHIKITSKFYEELLLTTQKTL